MLNILATAVLIFSLVIFYTRLCGLRSFSKMSSFDFAMTIAVGSIMGATILNKTITMGQGAFALLCLFFIQWSIAILKQKSQWVSDLIDNKPMLLMKDGEFLEANMQKCHVTKLDILSKLRESNVLNLSQIRAVIFETTGDIHVLHGDEALQSEILTGVEI